MKQIICATGIIGISLFVLVLSGGAYADETKKDLVSEDKFVPLDKIPELVTQVNPVYPEEAEQNGVTGKVIIKALIDKTGSVRKVKVGKSSGNDSLDEAAVQAAKGNTYAPGMKDGQPVAAWISYAVDFRLDEKDCKPEKD